MSAKSTTAPSVNQPAVDEPHGGQLVADVLHKQGVQTLFTLCGGHISPILIAAEAQGIRVVDVRDEATAAFAADATARLTGIPGVVAVTAGPGVTNTITAIKNAQMAQSPLVLIGGAAATLLQGRGALQDIDHMSVLKSLTKWRKAVKRVREIVPTLEEAFRRAQEGVPGPVFVELPVDLLYQESVVRDWTLASSGGKGLTGKAMNLYLSNHLRRTFAQAWGRNASQRATLAPFVPAEKDVATVNQHLQEAQRPVLVLGSQATLNAAAVNQLQEAVITLGIPTYLSGMARGLLGRHELHMRHKRSQALREADVIILAGVPCDFRMGYGRTIPRKATYIGVNRSRHDLTKNRKPTVAVQADPGRFLQTLAARTTPQSARWTEWHQRLTNLNDERDAEIAQMAATETDYVNPVRLCQQLEDVIDENSVIIGDGGDFVATASYILRLRSPLSWLDPGAFGTLGSGGGFALAAQVARPDAEVWLLYGDGSAGYTLAEFDTFARHGLPVIAVIGNDASWAQIARDQVRLLGSSLGTDLARTDYHMVGQGYGAAGLCVDTPDGVMPTLLRAKEIARGGQPVVVNVMIGQTDFRQGSLSM